MNATTVRIYDRILDDILLGKVPEKALLPTEVDLAAQFGASRMSAHIALKELERHGIVRSKRGAGTIVCKRPSPSLARHLRGLSAKRVHIVAGVEQPVALHWNESTLSELEYLLRKEGYAVSHVPIPPALTRDSLEQLLKSITAQGSSALVLILPASASLFCQEHASLIFQYHRNIFLFDRGDTPPESWPFHVVSLDPFSEGVLAAEYLYDKGYRRLSFWFAASRGGYWAKQRAAGFALGLRRASEGALTPQVWEGGGQGNATDAVRRLAEADGLWAVAAASDESASWLLDASAELDLRAPRDFGLIAFDNNPQLRAYNLTTIAPPVENIGRTLARALSGKLLPMEDFSSVVLRVPSRLIERDTCATVRPVEASAPPRTTPALAPRPSGHNRKRQSKGHVITRRKA
jgi:GntR family transcriptional regulator, arabinose operon transcriptional repressor